MPESWYKTTAILVGIVIIVSAIVGPTIGGIYWLVQVDRDVADLKTEVAELQSDVAELQTNVAELQRGQAIMLDILQKLAEEIPEMRADLNNHTHSEDGRAQFVGR